MVGLFYKEIPMSSTTQRYPLSTPDGIAIPFDVIRPYAFIRKAVDLTVSAEVNIPDSIEIISFAATQDCLVCFGGNATIGADGALQLNHVFIQKNTRVTVAPTANKFTVIAYDAAGYLYCQLIDKWAGLALETQYRKR
jgi:hypothetical protein